MKEGGHCAGLKVSATSTWVWTAGGVEAKVKKLRVTGRTCMHEYNLDFAPWHCCISLLRFDEYAYG
eukprot:104362-Pelagomonas_calceolata.AAC.19